MGAHMHISFNWALYMQFFIGLIALLNPFGLMPLFVGLTAHQQTEERNRTLNVAMLAVFITLVLLMITGQAFLNLFGISMASFRIAGGLMLMMIALSMLKGKLGEIRQNQEENLEMAEQELAEQESVAVVPLAIPIIAGPGAMSTVILYAVEHSGAQNLLIFSLIIGFVCSLCWMTFRCAPLLEKMMGKAGINVVTRLMGLIIVALSIEFIAAGIKELFPVLA